MPRRTSYQRREKDAYDTPASAVQPLLRFLPSRAQFVEPCAGRGDLVRHLELAGRVCLSAFDIAPRHEDVAEYDALHMTHADFPDADMIITNPPWDRKFLHPFIEVCRASRLPAWLLIDAGWAFTAQAAPYLEYCGAIVTVGRVRWVEDSRSNGFDDVAWYCFVEHPMQTRFHGKEIANG